MRASGNVEHDYEALRIILEVEFGRPVTFDEAKTTGEWLIGFYGKLTNNKCESNLKKLKDGIIKEHTT